PPETTRLPSGLKHAHLTPDVCPLRVSSTRPVCASHTFSSRSMPPATIRLPSGLKLTHTPDRRPLRGSSCRPVCASHTLITPSPRQTCQTPHCPRRSACRPG